MARKTKKQLKLEEKQRQQDFIIDKIHAEGLLPEAIISKYPDDTPSARTIYRWKRDDEAFRADLDDAYDTWLRSKVFELEEVSTKSARELFPGLESDKERFEARRARMDALKFITGKLAPVLNKRFSQKVEHEVSGSVETQIVVQNYALPQPTTTTNTIDSEVVKSK